MTTPRPPSLEEIEEDVAAAPHADLVFSAISSDTNGKADGKGDEVTAVAEQAVQFVLSYQRVKEHYAPSLLRTLRAVEQHTAELRTAVGTSSVASK